MKTHTIKTPTAELIIVEPSQSWGLKVGEEALLIYDHTKKVFGKTHTFKGSYTLLGKPDEIAENEKWDVYKPYKGSMEKETTKESLLSFLDSEIYWDVNPIKHPKDYSLAHQSLNWYAEQEKKFIEAEQKTFDRSRTLIFVKQ